MAKIPFDTQLGPQNAHTSTVERLFDKALHPQSAFHFLPNFTSFYETFFNGMNYTRNAILTLGLFLSFAIVYGQRTDTDFYLTWTPTKGFAKRVCGIHLTADSKSIDTTNSDLTELAPVLEILREGDFVCYPFFYSGTNEHWPSNHRAPIEKTMETALLIYLLERDGVPLEHLKIVSGSESGWMCSFFPYEMYPLLDGGMGCYILYFEPAYH